MLIKKVATSNAVKYSSIGIIGAGIGGLTAANAMLFQNTRSTSDNTHLVGRVSVYEQASEFIPTAGAGFGLTPNGQICLSSIGIDGYHDLYHPFDRIARIDKEGTQVRHESNVLRDVRDRHGFGPAGCLRADIVNLLVQNLKPQEQHQGDMPVINYSHKLTRITPHHDKVELEFENGHEDVVDLVIAADGINSSVAQQLNIDDAIPPIYSGANIFYGKIPNPNNPKFHGYFDHHPIFSDGSVVSGPGTGEFITFPVGAGDRKTFIWASTYVAAQPPKKREEEWIEGNAEELQDVLLSKYPNGHPIHDFARMTNEQDMLHFGLHFRHHRKTWTKGRVVLLGDSCHATLPYVGQGANQAIEDAIVLADAMAQHDGEHYAEAYQEYYDKRFPRTKRIVQMAGILHKLYHSKSWMGQMALEFLLRQVTNGGLVFKQIEKEIVDECPVKDFQQYVPKK